MSVSAVGGGGQSWPAATSRGVSDQAMAALQQLAQSEAAIEASMMALASGTVDGSVDTYA